MTAVEWRPVADYEGLYEVSDAGYVRSLPRPGARRNRMYGGQDLKGVRQITGYLGVNLGRRNKRYAHMVHVLVCEAFHGPRPEGMQVRHLNGNETDNRASNLAWGTRSENEIDKVHHGTQYNVNKTHCPQGHPYEGRNLIVARRGDGSVFRQCRACLNEANRRSKHRTYNLRPAETGGPS
jgi:hypothetical protein